MGQEADVSTYDAMHEEAVEYNIPVQQSIYYPMFMRVLKELERVKSTRSVLEVGCGSGNFASLLAERTTLRYRGFDFSAAGIAKAKGKLPEPDTFFTADALVPESYHDQFDAIVCTEVLEHIENDLGVVSLWPIGVHCVCSVPNFDYPTHVRHFLHEREVLERYSQLIDIESIIRVPRPIFTGKTLRSYLRDLRWARDQPKKMFGMMGINTFDWFAGWFVFSGFRRASS